MRIMEVSLLLVPYRLQRKSTEKFSAFFLFLFVVSYSHLYAVTLQLIRQLAHVRLSVMIRE